MGTKAYVECYEEIKQYEKKNNIFFDYIFHASGTTQAGLIVGQIINKDKRQIIGISIARKKEKGKKIISDSIFEYLDMDNIKYNKEKVKKMIFFNDNYILNGYGSNNNKIETVIKNSLINFGIPLDSTYTGKAFYGMQNYLKENKIENKNILFIHTGGTPLYFNDLERIGNEYTNN